MKNILIGVLAVFVLVGGALYWSVSSVVLGDEFVLHQYTAGEGSAGYGLLYVSFTKATTDTLTAWIDFDGNGTFADEEKVADAVPLTTRANWKSGVSVTLPALIADGTRVKIELDGGDNVEASLTVTSEDEDALMELSTVTLPEEAMKGWGAAVAYAKEPITEAGRVTPDIGQKIAECAPTSAANSLIALAQDNNREGDLPADADLINELKGDMDWTPENGVLPDDFVAGKNKWAARHGLPIRTEKVGGQSGQNTLQSLLDGLGEGNSAAELRIKFADASGKVTGGHMVTVTGVRMAGNQTFIEVSDPRTPEGSDTYRVDGNVIRGYPYKGLAILSWGFVQRWENTPTGIQLEPMTDAEIKGIQDAVGIQEKIKVIVVNKKHVPLSQVHVGSGTECQEGGKDMPHYHSNSGSVTALDGTVLPDNQGCGYGMVKNIPVIEVPAP